MPASPKVVFSRRVQARAISAALLFGLLTGCGISLSAGDAQTEVFKKLDIIGPLTPGAALTIELSYEQPYSISLDLRCDLLSTAKATPTPEPTDDPRGTPTPTPVRVPAPVSVPANRVSVILNDSIPPNPNGTTAGESTPVPGSIRHRFIAPFEHGRYVVHCYTPADRDNQIRKTIRIVLPFV